ncbi:MAG: hypothetical protein ACP5VP_11445 [Candidatus Limnocylindrales bacterium]
MSRRASGAAGKVARTDTAPEGARPSHAADQPPEWAQDPAMDGLMGASFGGQFIAANTRAAQAIWRQVPGVTEFDAELALAPLGHVPSEVAVAQARALVEARRRRPRSIPEDRWQHHLARVWDGLNEEERQDPEEILNGVLGKVATEHGAKRLMDRRPPHRPLTDRDKRLREVEAAVAALEEDDEDYGGAFDDITPYIPRPTRRDVATRLGCHPSTLRRWARRDPRIEQVLPSSGSPRRRRAG